MRGRITGMKIHLMHPPTTGALEILRDNLNPGIELIFGDQIPDPAEYQILVGGRPTREFVEASPNLKYLIIPWAGLPTSTRP